MNRVVAAAVAAAALSACGGPLEQEEAPRPSCGGQFGARVDIYDSAGGYAAGFSYASCW